MKSEHDLSVVLDQFERQYKRETSDPQMPVKYRSAKSVIAKAIRQGVPYLDARGVPRGKTAVEKECR